MGKKLKKCSGKFDFCWAWYENFTNGNQDYSRPPKGIGFAKMTDIKTMKPSRNLPFLRYGTKKEDSIALNYCPWCGADYRKLKRI